MPAVNDPGTPPSVFSAPKDALAGFFTSNKNKAGATSGMSTEEATVRSPATTQAVLPTPTNPQKNLKEAPTDFGAYQAIDYGFYIEYRFHIDKSTNPACFLAMLIDKKHNRLDQVPIPTSMTTNYRRYDDLYTLCPHQYISKRCPFSDEPITSSSTTNPASLPKKFSRTSSSQHVTPARKGLGVGIRSATRNIMHVMLMGRIGISR